ncbi:MAG TPA: RHS repeat-associated core domain-containing protein, partial [Acholeplasmataceae bacterium]|nr:RHS repeat-associated core domain-containing protein [Acholeplasmataceae bacterium]
MFDSNFNISYDINVYVENISKDKYLINIKPDVKWLEEATYPVTIDPTINGNSEHDKHMYIHDTYISSGTPNTNYDNADLMILANNDNYEYRGLLKFMIPGELVSNYYFITYSYLTLTGSYAYFGNQINIYRNTENYNYSTVTWNTKPDYDPNIVDYYKIRKLPQDGEYNKYTFDITKAVKYWAQVGLTNIPGFTIIDHNNVNNINAIYQSGSGNGPVIEIGYIDTTGIKDYWTYNSQSVGLAGTSYVCDLTGKLYLCREDINFTTDKQSLSLSFIYSADNKYNNIGYGNGWSTNYHISLYKKGSEYSSYYLGNALYYTVDGSGNKTYYIELDTGKLIAEDGSGNELTVDENRYKIKTKNNIQYIFDADGYLIEIADLTKNKVNSNNNLKRIIINRNSSNKNLITSIVDTIGNKITFYYSNNQLDYIILYIKKDNGEYHTLERVNYSYYTYSPEPSVQFSELRTVEYYKNYDSGAYLQLDETVNYLYDLQMNMTEAYEVNGPKLKYYFVNSKVSKIEAYEKTYIFGKLEYSYDSGRTKITDQDGNYIIYSFDDYGHTVNILDSDGIAQFFRYLNIYKVINEQGSIYTLPNGIPNYNNNHKLIEESKPQNTVYNPIRNNGFEYGLYDVYGWNKDIHNGNFSDLICVISSDESIYGYNSAKISTVNGAKGSLYQYLNLDKGVYTISGYVKNNATTNNVYIDIEGLNVTKIDNITNVSNDGKWHYIELGFRVNSDNSSIDVHLVNHSNGDVYFDNIHIVNGYKDTRKNIVNDSSFELVGINYWYLSKNTTIHNLNEDETGVYKDILGKRCIKMVGSSTQERFAVANISYDLDSTTDKTLVIGGWAKAENATPTTYKIVDEIEVDEDGDGKLEKNYIIEERHFRISVSLFDRNTQELIENHYIDFDPSVEGWQYVCREVTINHDSDLDIRLILQYLGEGIVYFDSIQVYEEKFGASYTYDDQGRLKVSDNGEGKTTSFDYVNNEDNRIKKIEIKVNGELIEDIETEYLNSELPLELSGIDFNNIKVGIDYTYEGEILKEKTVTVGDKGGSHFILSTKYNLNIGFGQYLDCEIDEFGSKTTYYYDVLTGLLEAIENAKNQDTHFIYDKEGKLIDVVKLEDYNEYDENNPNSYDQRVKYQYDSQDRLVKIIMDNNYYYEFIYDSQNRISEVKINSSTLVSYTYLMKNGYYTDMQASQKYGNGDIIKFIYNDKDLIEKVQFKDSQSSTYFDKFTYEYDHLDRTASLKIWDKNRNGINEVVKTEYYTYDINDRLVKVTDDKGNYIRYQYDSLGNLISLSFDINDETHFVNYNYNKVINNNRSSLYDYTQYTTKSNYNVVKEYIYEQGALKRLKDIDLNIGLNLTIKQEFAYYGNTTRIYIINYKINQIDYRYEYDYDELGNIVKILHKQNGVIVYEVEYQYDNLNQLKREDITINKTGFNISYFNEYQYDKHGNITSISTNKSGVTETINFNYNQIWFDKLNSYDIIKNGVTTKSVSYTYDGQGNPTSITNFLYNDIIYDKATLEWDGRQLKKINIIDDGQIIYSIEYKYNDAGYRIRKAITKYEYQYFVQDEVIYNDGIINGTALVPNTQNLFNYYDEVTVYIAGFGYHTFTSYGDLYIENYSFLGDLYLEVFPSGIYIYSPHSVWKVTGKILEVNVTETSTSTNYTLSNGKVIQETDGTYLIIYTYDYDGTLISFYYDNNINDSINGQEYFYIKNQQGDIIAIVNQYGQIIVEYIYDAWGNIIYVTNNEIARINPYTYRGYRYEWETSLYYLNSRYYNPEIGRFINADDVSYLEPGSLNGLNLYTYCENNPVMMVDPSGYSPEWWEWAISSTLIVGGIALCATGIGTGIGASLIVAGGSMMASNIMSAAGVEGKTASIISSGLNISAG